MSVYIYSIEIISFGCLKNVSIKPGKGVNLFDAPNESGKTTLACFLKYIFYGFSGERVTKSISDNEKKLYSAWDGTEPAGAVCIHTDRGDYRIIRESRSKKETHSITDINTGKRVGEGIDAGEYFFGVGEGIFCRTAFLKQMTSPVTKDPQTADRLQALAVNGDETTNTKQAISELLKQKNRIDRGQKALLNTHIDTLEKYETRLQKAMGDYTQIEELYYTEIECKKQLDECEKRLETLEREKQNFADYECVKRISLIEEYDKKKTEIKKQYDELSEFFRVMPEESDIAVLRESSRTYLFALEHESKADTELENACKALEKTEKIDHPQKNLSSVVEKHRIRQFYAGIFLLMGAALLIGGLAVIISSGASTLPYSLLGTGVLFCSLCAVMYASAKKVLKKNGFSSIEELKLASTEKPIIEYERANALNIKNKAEADYEKAKSEVENAQKAVCAMLEKYVEIKPYESYDEAIDRIDEKTKKIQRLKSEYEAAFDTYNRLMEGNDLEEMKRRAAFAVEPKRDEKEAQKEYDFLHSKKQSLNDKLSDKRETRIRLESVVESPALLEDAVEKVKTSISELKLKSAAYELAAEQIEESSDELRQIMAPRLSKEAGRMLSAATGGKYSELYSDTQLALTYSDHGFEREFDYLSLGTRISAYVCLRLALSELFYSDCFPPVVFDDAFVYLDDDRLAAMLGLLSELADDRQIFIMSCTKRERMLLEKNGTSYTEISVQSGLKV